MTLHRIPIKAAADGEKKKAEVLIYKPIGNSLWDEGVDAKRFADDLKALGELDEIDVRINSPGGSVWDGLAIFNTLVNHKAQVNVYVDGLAASAASFIAMAATPGKLCMAENAIMMIHCAQGVTYGDAREHDKTADILRQHDQVIAQTYARRTGRRPETMMKLMEDETWMTAEEAKGQGLCDEITPAKKMAACADLAKITARFRHPPADLAQRLAAEAPAEAASSAEETAATPATTEQAGGEQPTPAAAAMTPAAAAVRLRLLELEEA